MCCNLPLSTCVHAKLMSIPKITLASTWFKSPVQVNPAEVEQ